MNLDNILMIGSAGANVGKTELACALIRKFSRDRNIVGVKVTTIKAKDGQCPRGGEGCGVCSSLEGEFCITEETNSDSDKDTTRLLAAGASQVFWLRIMNTHLEEGLRALMDIIGHNTVSVCESNSLRQVVKPGLFLIVKGRDSRAWKSSAQQVKEYADRIVVCDGEGFDLDIDQIRLIDKKWVMEEKATAIIMAGGDSSRMGSDKSMLPVNGKPIIEIIAEQLRGHFEQILISTNEAEKLAFLGFEIVPDKVPGQGPLMGIASALEASSSELNFVVACDIPNIDLSCVRRMLAEAVGSGADIIVPTTGDQRYEPLFAVYNKSALGAMNKILSSGGRKISDVFAMCEVRSVEFGDAQWLANLNTIAEYEEFRKKSGSSVHNYLYQRAQTKRST